MSSSPSEKKSSDVEMGEANSALPTPAMHEATPTFIAGFLSFKERLSRRSAEKEGGRIQPEVPAILSSPAMSTSAGGNKSPGDATPLAESAMVPVQVPQSIKPFRLIINRENSGFFEVRGRRSELSSRSLPPDDHRSSKTGFRARPRFTFGLRLCDDKSAFVLPVCDFYLIRTDIKSAKCYRLI
ncbi:hypothetical protein F2Q68_00044135 [Brassica cretica]|uniref:Uncharacterized protein n=1 Tax=Brassica cretica TaxID=69181 RepID=A0A8S9LS95_BRACR|nr:hypothetical protein F2Q68_00044135 [Brassica cretica]